MPKPIPSNFSKIQDRIFIGSAYDAHDRDTIANHGITALVTVALEFNPDTVSVIRRVGLHDEFPNCEANTDEQILDAVNALTELHDAGHRVLVHCRVGHNRSVATVVGWLVKSGQFKTVSDAYKFVEDRHESTLQPLLKRHLSRLYDPT